MSIRYQDSSSGNSHYPKTITLNGTDVKCIKKYLETTPLWSKYIFLRARSASVSYALSPQYSEPSPYYSRQNIVGQRNTEVDGAAYWGDKLTITWIGTTSSHHWPMVQCLLVDKASGSPYGSPINLPIKSGTTTTFDIDNVDYPYDMIYINSTETLWFADSTLTAGVGFYEGSTTNGVLLTTNPYDSVTANLVNESGWVHPSDPSVTPTTSLSSKYGDTVYAYARTLDSNTDYGTTPSSSTYIGIDNGYDYYYLGAYQRQDQYDHDFGRVTLGSDHTYSVTKTVAQTSRSLAVALSNMVDGADEFTSGHKLRFYQFTIACGGKSASFTSPLSYGTSATVSSGTSITTLNVSMTWNGTSRFTFTIMGPTGNSYTAFITIKELLHTPS